ncbi:MAG: hypothetical protein H0V97_07185 [Actinobacteria bacterium]|nr:hypothetical protein [Actinomycetota bacterium]
MRRALLLVVACALSSAGCYAGGSAPSVSETRPTVAVSFPETASPGAIETASIEVTNPGPQAFRSLFVTFSVVAIPGEPELPRDLVAPGRGGLSPTVEAVRPEPAAVTGGVVYRFSEADTGEAALPVGGTRTVEFDIRLPEKTGLAASSVQVYPGENPERAGGALLRTTVR